MKTYNLEYTITNEQFITDYENDMIDRNIDYTDINEELYNLSHNELCCKLEEIKQKYYNININNCTIIEDRIVEIIIYYNESRRLLSIEITEN